MKLKEIYNTNKTSEIHNYFTQGYCKNFYERFNYASKTGFYKCVRNTGLFLLDTYCEGMFLIRDKLPMIAFCVSLGGIPLPDTDVILNGNQNRALVKSDYRGIIADYLPIDTYSSAILISPNYIVYLLINDELLDEFIHIFHCKKATIANANYRMLHRNFI